MSLEYVAAKELTDTTGLRNSHPKKDLRQFMRRFAFVNAQFEVPER